MMKLYLDNIIFSIQKSGGISVVWHEMIIRLLKKSNYQIYFIDFTGSEKNIFRREISLDNNSVYYFNGSNVLFYRYFDLFFKTNEIFIFHSSYYRICKNVNAINITTIHDFTYEKFGRGLKKYIHIWQKYKAIRRSKKVICISYNTKLDLIRYVKGIDESKISVIYNGVSDDYFIIDNKISSKFPFDIYKYIVFVGSRVSYKKFDFCVDVVSKTDYKLVIVGSELSLKESRYLESKMKKNNFILLKNISNLDLNIIYNGAFCLFYPSSYEGFGIPVIEAQKAGCPVIAYNGSSIPEIIGDKSLLFDNYNIEEVIEKIGMLVNEEDRERIISKGIENSKRFSWENTYNELIDIYEEVWNER